MVVSALSNPAAKMLSKHDTAHSASIHHALTLMSVHDFAAHKLFCDLCYKVMFY